MGEDWRNRAPPQSVMSATDLAVFHHAARIPLQTQKKYSRITILSLKWSAHEFQLLPTLVRKQSFNQMVPQSITD